MLLIDAQRFNLVVLLCYLVLKSRNFQVAALDSLVLRVDLVGQTLVFLLSFAQKSTLLIDFGLESLDKLDISLHAALEVFIHAATVFVQTPKVLFHV